MTREKFAAIALAKARADIEAHSGARADDASILDIPGIEGAAQQLGTKIAGLLREEFEQCCRKVFSENLVIWGGAPEVRPIAYPASLRMHAAHLRKLAADEHDRAVRERFLTLAAEADEAARNVSRTPS